MPSIKSLSVAGLAAVLGLSQTAAAYITAMYTDATASNGTNIDVTLNTEIYIQNNLDYGVIWGLADPSLVQDCDQCVGTYLGYTELLGASGVPNSGNFTLEVPIPSSVTAGDYTLVASIPTVMGASGETSFNVLSANVTITN